MTYPAPQPSPEPPADTPPGGPRRWARRRLLLAGTAALVAIAVAVVLIVTLTGQHHPPAKITMTGIITVAGNGGGSYYNGKACPAENLGPNGDIAVGTQIVVHSNTGAVIGTGTILAGRAVPGAYGNPVNACNYAFKVPRLPSSPFYEVQIPGHGQVTVPRTDARHVRLTIGG